LRCSSDDEIALGLTPNFTVWCVKRHGRKLGVIAAPAAFASVSNHTSYDMGLWATDEYLGLPIATTVC
jgi:hypothetical protein